ncbi:MAG: hypothetical protein Kow00123_05410 [Anaerolineales bacterium]
MRTGPKWILRAALVILAVVLIAAPAAAQDYRFQVNERLVHVYINDDGSIWIDYTITFTADPGSHPIDIVDIGLPNYDYNLAEIKADVGGVEIKDIRHSEYVKPGVEIHMGKFTIPPGGTGTLHVLARVRNMVFQDTSDPDYASMEFIPHWYDSANAHGTMHLEIVVHFPEGVTSEESRYHDTKFTDAAIVDNRVTYAWIYPDASPSQPYKVGVSFPKKYLKSGVELKVTPEPLPPAAGGTSITDILCSGPMCVILGVLAMIAFVAISIRRGNVRKMKYLPPTVGVEGAGVKRGLTAVEAALLLEAPLNRVLTMILFGLLKKGAVTVLSDNPLRLQANVPAPEDLRDYEKEFLASIVDNQLDEKKLRQMMVGLVKAVNEKMKGFSRKDSVAYYKDLVSRAWQQVEAAETPEVKAQRLDEGLEWTMLDEDWNKKVGRTFGDEPVLLPGWWGYYRPWATSTSTASGGTQTTSAPRTSTGDAGRTPTMPTLPGAAFANTIVSGVESLSNRVVSSVERFTGSISSVTNPPPPPPRTSSSGRWRSGGGGGGCACACACACAGCACACAGGGR